MTPTKQDDALAACERIKEAYRRGAVHYDDVLPELRIITAALSGHLATGKGGDE